VSPARRRPPSEPRPGLVVHPACLLAMDPERHARAVAAVKALLVGVLRDEQATLASRADPPDRPPAAPANQRAA
jgi:hypothetical protein